MVKQNRGNLLVTNSTAMGGRRMLCQSLYSEYAPQKIHVAQIVIDSPVNTPDTLGKY
jgi:hypothetical protein